MATTSTLTLSYYGEKHHDIDNRGSTRTYVEEFFNDERSFDGGDAPGGDKQDMDVTRSPF